MLRCASADVLKEAVTAVMYHTLIWQTQHCRVGRCLCMCTCVYVCVHVCVSGRAGWESVFGDLLPLQKTGHPRPHPLLISLSPALPRVVTVSQKTSSDAIMYARCDCENNLNHISLLGLHQSLHKTICACVQYTKCPWYIQHECVFSRGTLPSSGSM